ncbi:MAG TPA: HepT-like ribonuclease domain-containing protein [Longimicrobiales bacterium]
MPHDDRLPLEQMLDAARRLSRLARERGRATFDDDDVLRLAMLQLIQRLGESASRLSADFRFAHPELPWAEMIGLRNRIVHSYDDLDPDIIWHVASADVEPVIAALERVLER